MHVYPYRLPTECAPDSVEYVDSDDRPLLVAPLTAAGSLGLPFRSVGVALRDRKRRIFVRRQERGKAGKGLWDLSVAGAARCGESPGDAALRHTCETLGLPRVALRRLAVRLPEAGSVERLTLFLAGPALPSDSSHGMFLDAVELDGLLAHFPELLAPRLVWASSYIYEALRKG